MQNSLLKRDVIILTSNQIVYKVIRSYLTILDEITHPQGTIYEYGTFVSENRSWDIGILQVPDGNINSAFEAERAIGYADPSLLFSLDLAYGSNCVKSGDVIVADKVYAYEHGKAANTFLTMPEVGKSSYGLIQRAQNVASYENWYKRIREIPGIDLPAAFVAPIAAGEKEITAGSPLWSFLEEHYNDTLAIDMASSGFLEAAHGNQYIQALIIRGIIHSGDQIKLKAAAANHASAFAFEVLSKLEQSLLHINHTPTSALEVLTQLVQKKNPAEISAQKAQEWLHKGNEFSHNGQDSNAISAYEEALKLEKKNPVIQNKYGEALFRLEKYRPAIKAFEKAIESNQHYSLAYRNKGDAFVRIGDYDGAFGCYVHALQCDRKNWAAYIGQGYVLCHQKHFEEATKIYRQLIRAPKEARDYKAEAYRGLGDCLREQGKYSEAICSYEDALERNPGDAFSYKSIGDSYNGLKDYQSAIKAYDISIARKPEVSTCNAKGCALLQLKEYGRAIEAFDQTIRLDRKNLMAYKHKIDVLKLLKLYKDAHDVCDKALRFAPKDASIYKDKGDLLRQLCRFTEAIHTYDTALMYNPEDASLYRGKGSAFIGINEHEKAIELFNAAIACDNDIYSYRCKIGTLGEICKSYPEAIQVCDEALLSFPDDAEIQQARAIYLARQKSQRSLADCDTEILFAVNMSIRDERLSQENSGSFLAATQIEESSWYDDYRYTLETTYPLPVVRQEKREKFPA